jgi:hypothetical protein
MGYTKEEKAEWLKNKVEGLQTKLAEGVAELTTSDDWKKWLDLQTKLHRYSFRNIMLMMLQCPHVSMVMGKKQWWTRAGRKLMKGEWSNAIEILAPRMRYFKVKKNDGTEESRKYVNGWLTVRVFDVSQTQGRPLPTSPVEELKGQSEEKDYSGLLEIAESNGYKVTLETMSSPKVGGYCDYREKHIALNDSRSHLHRTKTLVHEIAHAILHCRTDDEGNLIYPHDRETDEVEAESVAYVVMGALGYDTSEYSFGYVAGWSGGKAEKVMEVGARVSKGAKQILNSLLGEEG